MVASLPGPLSPDNYLHLEAESPIKHEYIDGYAYAIAGATDAHVTISLNLVAMLRNHLQGSGCRLYISDMKARVEARNCYYYPDVMVTCDPRDAETDTYKRFPKLIVEVLSTSTEAFDRGDKFANYQALESLEEYVLINTRHQRVESFRRGADGLWLLQHYTPTTKQFEIKSLQFRETLTALYEDVVLEASEEREPSDDPRERG
ncbi:MAG TPA: Uma2 family endonuclease [Candidatus Obscuribacterales bacterium]